MIELWRVVQSMDRGSSSVLSKTRTLTPFRLRSNREDLAALCQQAAVSTLPGDPQPPPATTDRHRSAVESTSISPQIARRALDQRLLSSKTTATGSSASLDAPSRLQVIVVSYEHDSTARDVIYTSRAYATMSVSVCLSVGLSVTEVHWRIIQLI